MSPFRPLSYLSKRQRKAIQNKRLYLLRWPEDTHYSQVVDVLFIFLQETAHFYHFRVYFFQRDSLLGGREPRRLLVWLCQGVSDFFISSQNGSHSKAALLGSLRGALLHI